ncbi:MULTISPECIES: glutaredoxin family protein [Thermodesulfovibrio]|uniref:Glutaredoxin n=1 Tax=Thermodesulfovibrio yellowstonii (strain ATCC 51303 / DSM 11347 / YP87) TaxID=289376 RepID=B5YHT4_THEYD|nr:MULTISPECIES: glutaredoxin family protein [Thermodesulfovibrio]ACI20310.1 glutaredoxin [Thermodesulfovibrio yellowstonii DSM 11347]MBC7190698.1 glutaredoxin family protein [Candidatus Aerophobetes bacterium]MDI6865870.1 glutaredoxin family protein [Thermodesulfovibrio yellowstonii]
MLKRVRLYSLSTCPVCKKVKEFLKNNSIETEIIEVDTLDSGEQWLAMKELKKINPDETFPTLVVETAVVGLNEEELKKILEVKD